ncbi:MAG: hypothetical protein ONB42_03455 [candidate division KSB1 bacterium]|nr:hypothetical protein [candidate division KSB1 bacterium]
MPQAPRDIPMTPDAVSYSSVDEASSLDAERSEENDRAAEATANTGTISTMAPSVPALPRATSISSTLPELVPLQLPIYSPQRNAILKKVRALVSRPITSAAFDSSFTWGKNGQFFQFEIHHQPARSATHLDELFITVTTFEGEDTLSTRLRMSRLAFSQFAQFVDYWDPHVAVHDDEFDGRFHSNSALLISGSRGTRPKFRGKVTTADYSFSRHEGGPFLDSREIFIGGVETGTDPIPLPRVFFGISHDTTVNTGPLKSFTEETWLTFHPDGTYSWHTVSAPQTVHKATLSNDPNCIIGRGKAKLHVKGVVKGTLLIYSENKIVIDDDLLYARDPEVSTKADDFLGLVSAKDIEIAPPSVTGPGDLKIYAAILAKGWFRVTHLYSRHEGTLHIYGSLSAGSISATEPRYATRIRFDKRFEKMRPPNFPMTNRYEITEWDERWVVAPK